MVALFLVGGSIVVILLSLIGGIALAKMRIAHAQMQSIVSMIAGLMLGVTFLHLLPMAVELLPGVWPYGSCLAGLLGMFFLIRIFDFHQHCAVEEEECDHEHVHTHQHSQGNHAEEHSHAHGDHSHSEASWVGMAIGLSVHSLIDGFAFGAAVISLSLHSASVPWASIGIILAIALHKPLDSMMVSSMMLARGRSFKTIVMVNVMFALACPIGVLLMWMGADASSEVRDWVLGLALAFSAGTFLCISLGDLLPELHFHSHDRVKLSVFLLIGIGLACLIEMLPHSHDHGHGTSEEVHHHEHSSDHSH